MCINELMRQAALCPQERPRYAYMAPLYRQAKTIAWDYLRHYAGVIPGMDFNEAELAATMPNGARIELLGAQDYHYLRGRYLDGIVLDEYAYMVPEAWTQVIRPALVDRKGWAVFIGTPLGRNHFFELYEKARARPEFLTAMWPASRTGIVPADELEAARRDMAPEEYQQEFECSFEAAIRGAYYAKEITAARADGRIRPIPIEPSIPVETWWDIGFRDATAIIFTQTVGREIRLVDYVEESGQALPYYAKTLQERPYLYARHHLPHDAEKTELGTGKSIYEQLRAMGVKPLTIGRALPVMDGIQTARVFLARCWVDERRCARLLDRLATYRAEWDEKRQMFKDKPYHDPACLAGETELVTPYGMRQVQYLPERGEVLTPCGWKPYQDLRITRRDAPLVAVEFSDGTTVRCTPEHRWLTDAGWRCAADLQPTTAIQSCSIPSGTLAPSAGLAPMGGSPRPRGMAPPRGMRPTPVASGISVMLARPSHGRSGNESPGPVIIAEQSFRPWSGAPDTLSGGAQPTARRLRITSVRWLPERADVWCLTVPDGHWYTLANGAISHNSHGADAFRYLAVDHRGTGGVSTRPEVKSQFDPINHGRPAAKPRVVSRWTP
jgi:hypothetical protein